MVILEWQNALYKSTKEEIKIIPVKIDDCMMPAVISQTLYIDIFGQGLEPSIKQMIDVIKNKNTYVQSHGYQNIRAYVKESNERLVIEFRAEIYIVLANCNYLWQMTLGT